ncbi:hypothetical protein PMI02_04089 [Novosphingobium sp. AP12]|nr:hypothetical protein PMI02_04089 [Novosphingobium sp. AP12]
MNYAVSHFTAMNEGPEPGGQFWLGNVHNQGENPCRAGR